MTPTLWGRWQTRLLLLATVGVLITLPFALGFWGPEPSPLFGWILVYVAAFGLAWDAVYNYLQKLRWDHDWPGALQLLAGLWELLFLTLLIKTVGLPGISQSLPAFWFVLHYSLVWLAVYIAGHSLVRLLFPRWRFRGGQWF